MHRDNMNLAAHYSEYLFVFGVSSRRNVRVFDAKNGTCVALLKSDYPFESCACLASTRHLVFLVSQTNIYLVRMDRILHQLTQLPAKRKRKNFKLSLAADCVTTVTAPSHEGRELSAALVHADRLFIVCKPTYDKRLTFHSTSIQELLNESRDGNSAQWIIQDVNFGYYTDFSSSSDLHVQLFPVKLKNPMIK